jgi:hypothetical protein
VGANVELDIFLKRMNFSFNSVFSVLKDKGFSVYVKELQVFDDWEYTNQENIDSESIDLDATDLFFRKFTRIYFVVNNTWRCTLLTSFENAYIMQLSFGLNSNDLVLPGSSLNDLVGPLYEKVIKSIDENMSREPFQDVFFAATLGVEYSVDFYNDIAAMVNKRNGGAKWLVPKKLGASVLLNGFVKEEKRNVIVFTKKF